jgi:GTPase SAR1 family protein
MNKKSSILVCGQAGSGKTSLIQAVCPEGTVPFRIKEKANIKPDLVFETKSVTFHDSCIVNDKASYDCIWYCIDAIKAVVEQSDIAVLKFDPEHTIVLLTKEEIANFEDVENLIQKLQIILPKENIISVSSYDCVGLQNLLSRSRDIIIGDIFTIDEARKQQAFAWDDCFDIWNNYSEELSVSYFSCISAAVNNIIRKHVPKDKQTQ